MVRSLYSGVSGLRNHQTRMDVIGDNIANVNTYGFKASRVSFQDIYNQTLGTGSSASGNLGGTNPRQVGLGMTVASIDVLHNAQTGVQTTGEPLDMAISGDGFFVVKEGDQVYLTRNGNFTMDSSGNLLTRSGLHVQGVMFVSPGTDADGNTIDPLGTDLDALLAAGGETTDLENIVFPDGYTHFQVSDTGLVTAILEDPSLADPSDPDAPQVGDRVMIGQIFLGTVTNPSGLVKSGNSLYATSNNSGVPVFNVPGYGRAGDMQTSVLEFSNVDLASEFTEMIVTQRGYQACSRIVTVSDTLLEELINLKR